MTWEFWAIIGSILLIIELFIPTLVALSLSVACFVTSIFAYVFDLTTLTMQLVIFSVTGLFLFLIIRPIALKLWFNKNPEIKTNSEALIGAEGMVTETIDNLNNTGRVLVMGDDWKAKSSNDDIIDKGSKVIVEKVDSTILIVKKKQ